MPQRHPRVSTGVTTLLAEEEPTSLNLAGIFVHDPLYVCHMSHAKRNTPTNMNNQPMCLFTISFQIGTKLLKGKTMKTLVTE